MIFISHRGNIYNRYENDENKPKYILEALNLDFFVEIDLWIKSEKLYLGHDEPKYIVDKEFINNYKLFVHCKNVEALSFMNESKLDCDYFWHDKDDYTLTAKGKIWTYMGKYSPKNSISLMPELFEEKDLSGCFGICSDKIIFYRNKYQIT